MVQLSILVMSLIWTFCGSFRTHSKTCSSIFIAKRAALFSTANLSILHKKYFKEPEDIESLGEKIASICDSGDVILLSGDLGAGKTTFARGFIRSKFDDDRMRVTSPSYLLDNTYEYDEGKMIHHMDLYRLPTNADLSMLGIPEIFSTCICLVEWPQRMSSYPKSYLEMIFHIQADESRLITFNTKDAKWNTRLNNLFGSNGVS